MNMTFVKWGIVALIGAVVAGLAYNGSRISGADIHAQFVREGADPAQVAYFELYQEKFPQEYKAHLAELADIANGPEGIKALETEAGFQRNVAFGVSLRRTNAHYASQAPLDAMRAVNVHTLTVLEALVDMPLVCGKFAMGGASLMTKDEVLMLDQSLILKQGLLTLELMAAGRDTPVEHPEVGNGDIVQAVSLWQQQPGTTADMMSALTSGDPAHPFQCAANISFQRFIVESDDPVVERAVIRIAALTLQV